MTGFMYQSSYSINRQNAQRKRRIFLVRRTIALAILLAVSFTFGAIVQASAQDHPKEAGAAESVVEAAKLYGEKIVVEPGMTLWGIASEHKPDGTDVRIYINKIQRHNQLEGSGLQVGQVLYLP